MDELNMDEDFDFAGLSIEEPEERLQSMFERSFNIDTQQEKNAPAVSAIPTAPLDQTSAATSDNGPWAKLPSTSEINPYLPGITAQKLDAMASDPNHVFKSSQTPFPFPLTVPPGSDSADQSIMSGDKYKEMEQEDEEERLPAWMLKDPEMAAVPTWSQKDASAPGFSSKEFALDWSSSTDLSTAVDSNALFGFSSFPTYEALPISNVIAEEQQRRMYDSEPGLKTSNTSSSSISASEEVQEGGFAKYGYTNLASTPMSGDRQQGMVVAGDIANQWNGRGASSITSTTNTSKTNEWQDWRSIPPPNQDIEIDRDYAEEFYALDDDSKNSVKITPGFAPAKFRWEDD